MKERTIYNMIEDVDHPEVTTTDLLDILLFLENNLDNGTDETKIFAKALFAQLVEKSHYLYSEEIKVASAIFYRFNVMSTMKDLLPRIEKSIDERK